jgi:hypothetical protein
VRKYVDLFREHVFDIISQFTAIFLDVPSSSSVSSSTSSSSSHTPSPVAAAQLASFAEQCVADLVSLVSASVPRMTNDTAALSSILVQIGYCSLAFARVGLDFAPLVTEPFLSAVLLAFSETVEAGTRAFAKTLSRDAKSNSNPVYTLVAPEYVPILLASEPSTFVPWDGKGAPPELARLPPLALLLNSHLAALNALRLLAPTHLYPRLAAAQASSLKSATQALAAFLRASADPPAPTGVRRGELSAEARAARKAEMRAASVAAVQAWTHVLCPLLLAALPNGIFEGVPALPAPELDAVLAELRAWVEENGEKKVKENGTAAEIVPAVAAITAAVVADSEPAAEELKQNSEKEQAETPVPEQTAATAPTPSTPPATSAPAEASVPEPAPEPAVEPAAEPTVELIEPTTEPVTEPAAEPIAEPEAAPEPPQPTETELTTAPTDEPAHEPTEPAPEPSTETAEPPTAPALQPPDAEPDMQTQADATNEPEADTTPATPASPRAEARTGGVPDDDDVPPGPGAGPGPEYSPEAKGVEAEQREPQQSEPQHEVIVEVESVAEPVEEAAPVTESASPDTPAEPETPAETAAPAEAAAAPEEPAADDEAEGKGETPSESRAASPTPDEPAAAAAGGGSGAAKKKKNKKKGKKK